jgi:lipopolysaccharide biosynthesis regulator YciM
MSDLDSNAVSASGASHERGEGGATRSETVPPRRQTLPAPDWSAPRSVSALALEWLSRHAPVARRPGARAELASLRAKLKSAARAHDVETERVCAAALARALASRGAELDAATRLARRALLLGEEASLREELSSWFAALGEPALAAATLKALVDNEMGERLARLLTRIAVFLGRHGDPRGAADALASAARSNPGDPVPEELRGAIAAWAPEAVPPKDASDAYLEAARRHEAKGDSAAAFEDLMRAFEIAPGHAPAAQRLAAELAMRGRAGAADEVLREHARAAPDRALSTHRGRLRDAVVDGDSLRALGAAFDAGLDLGFDPRSLARSASSEDSGEELLTFERILADVGLHDVVAARLELAAEALTGYDKSRARVALGRVAGGALGSTERAVDAFIDALVADPSNEDAKSLLREHAAASGDHWPLVEALIRAGLVDAASLDGERCACLRELLVLAEQKLDEPTLALWAVQRLQARDPRDDELRAIGARLSERSGPSTALLAAARAALPAEKGPAHVEGLQKLASLLRGRPDDAAEFAEVLDELSREAPDDRASRHTLERVLARLGRVERLEALYRLDLSRPVPRPQHERARLWLSAMHRTRGEADAATQVLVADEAHGHRGVAAMVFALATKYGDGLVRGDALRRLASGTDGPLSALLSSVAAEAFLAEGDVDDARRAAEIACHADSSSPRSVVALARATMGQRDRIAAVALERAASVVMPRMALCQALAATFDALGEPAFALAWTQRALALRPSDRATASALLERVIEAGDARRIGDSLAWLLSQPEPLLHLVPLVVRAITRLAELDPPRSGALGRRALDVFGPRIPEIREVVLRTADAVGDPALAIAVLERQLASGTPGGDRAQLLLDLARRRRLADDPDGAAATLARALSEGADPAAVLTEIKVALPPRSSDGELSLLEAHAEALSAVSSAELGATARVWRELGAARWDLGDDHEGAFAAWERGAALDGEHGLERLARDLVAFAGHNEAVRRLEDIAMRRRNRADVARALAAAAGVALDGGLDGDALSIAIRALEADSSRADVLAIAERSAADKDIDQLERAYDIIARGSLGTYGERAAHYRAARKLERRGFRELALRHAILAFEAVPSEGVAFVLMMRLAERTGDSTEAVQSIERVASRSAGSEERAVWLRRAALVAGSGDEGKRQRVDVLLRALEANPHGETLRSLALGLAELVRTMPDEKDIAELRFARALRTMLPRLHGPEGARIAVGGATTAFSTFGDVDVGVAAMLRATDADASIDEYSALLPHANLVTDDKAEAFVTHVTELVSAPYSNVGFPLVELAEAVGRGVPAISLARLLVAAALRFPEDAELVRRAESRARAAGDRALVQVVRMAMPVDVRVNGLIEHADTAGAAGDSAAAIEALEEARATERLPDELRPKITDRLRRLYRDLKRFDVLQALLRDEMERETASEARIALGRELASVLTDTGHADEATVVISGLLESSPKRPSLYLDLLTHAQASGDARRQIEALSVLVGMEDDAAKRLPLLRRLALLLGAEGDEAGALLRYQEILALDDRDTVALAALERDAERRGDWDGLAELLRRRSRLPQSMDDRRRIRLHLAQMLESRLGRPEDARAELESLLVDTGDNQVVLTTLADLNERLGAKLRAAALWLRASAFPKDRNESAELSRRACQAYLDGGDVESARRVFAEMRDFPRTAKLVALHVDIARRGENPEAYSEALEEMALSSMEPPHVRATLLVEAARAALAANKLPMALGQAQRAARIARESADAQLLARQLEYRVRGAGNRDEAFATLAELRAVRAPLDAAQREVHAFLLAEALDVAIGTGEGLRELLQAEEELGSLPLIALGKAERAAAESSPERSLPMFDRALEGDLRELRIRGEVALAAARAAERAHQPDRALEYLEVAAAMPDTRARALGAQTELRAALGRIVDAGAAFDTPAPPADADGTGAADGEHVIALRKPIEEPVLELKLPAGQAIELRSPSSQRPALFVDNTGEPMTTASPDGSRSSRNTAESNGPTSDLRKSAPPKPMRRTNTLPGTPAPPGTGSQLPPLHDAHPGDAERSHGEGEPAFALDRGAVPWNVPSSAAAAAALQPLARGPLTDPPASAAGATMSPTPSAGTRRVRSVRPPPQSSSHEEALFSALSRGSIEAGRELMLQLENRRDRTQDLVSVCRRVAHHLPGDRSVLEKLYEATLADRNIVYARAVEHVLRAFDSAAEPLSPPPLADQVEQPDRVRAVLFRDMISPATEALSLVWSGAQHMFRRDPSSYGVTGLERVSPTSPTPLARQFAAASRLLGMTRTPLFQRKGNDSITIEIALLSSPALLLTGDVKNESALLGYHLGVMLAATMPEHVLLYGAADTQVENVLRALVAAFGPPQAGRGHLANVATLAEMLWETMPARSQRRLRELCDDPSRLDYGLARAAAKQAVRRAGLFVSGDVTVAIRETCADLGVSTWGLDAPGGLAALCSSSPAVADLVRLATSPEYASTRWQQGRPPGRQPGPQ